MSVVKIAGFNVNIWQMGVKRLWNNLIISTCALNFKSCRIYTCTVVGKIAPFFSNEYNGGVEICPCKACCNTRSTISYFCQLAGSFPHHCSIEDFIYLFYFCAPPRKFVCHKNFCSLPRCFSHLHSISLFLTFQSSCIQNGWCTFGALNIAYYLFMPHNQNTAACLLKECKYICP